MGKSLRQLLTLLIGVGVVGLIVLLFATAGHPQHKVNVTIKDATGILPGQEIRAAGVPAGTVDNVETVDHGRMAKLTLDIDDSAWPLPKGTSFTSRWSGTIDEYNRYIELDRGPDGGASIVGANDSVPAADFHSPVEYGQLLSDFTPGVRESLKTFLNNAGNALNASKSSLRTALKVAPPAISEANKVIEDLDANEQTLKDLLNTTSRVTGAVDSASPGLNTLLEAAGGTFSTIASEDDNLKNTLSGAPKAMETAEATLAKANPTLKAVDELTTNIRPGVSQLIDITTPLNDLLGKVDTVGPDLQSTLDTAVTQAPHVTALLQHVTAVAPELTSVAKQANTSLECIRPYTPEIVSFGTNWGSALSGQVDGNVYIRAEPEVFLPNPAPLSTESPAAALKNFPSVTDHFPMAPGDAADQPWYLPQCGVSAANTDPANDPEYAAFQAGIK